MRSSRYAAICCILYIVSSAATGVHASVVDVGGTELWQSVASLAGRPVPSSWIVLFNDQVKSPEEGLERCGGQARTVAATVPPLAGRRSVAASGYARVTPPPQRPAAAPGPLLAPAAATWWPVAYL